MAPNDRTKRMKKVIERRTPSTKSVIELCSPEKNGIKMDMVRFVGRSRQRLTNRNTIRRSLSAHRDVKSGADTHTHTHRVKARRSQPTIIKDGGVLDQELMQAKATQLAVDIANVSERLRRRPLQKDEAGLWIGRFGTLNMRQQVVCMA